VRVPLVCAKAPPDQAIESASASTAAPLRSSLATPGPAVPARHVWAAAAI